ncbi:response regulator [Kovacikia minuta CCNUW1]|uniref:response regulator n=1 Tax=Kovacikia minuta TaxID=2931930 RepID=UPI001CCCF88A|nr:response regulator [Kovacikia minuta]UBF25505.1 response regulator [Kovacikia minuta CCNUW1]
MSSGAIPFPNSDILVVDDTPSNLRLLSDLLTAQGYQVRKIADGRWAIQAAQLSPPDLILLDIVMPGINGYEVCRLLKANERTREVPVIFLSVNDEVLDKVQAFRMGGVDYITKPFEPAEVLVRVETQLKLSQLQKQVQEQNLQLQTQNLRLQKEMSDRTATQLALDTLTQNLETKLRVNTSELTKQNQQLLHLQAQLKEALEQTQRLSQLKSELLHAIVQEFYNQTQTSFPSDRMTHPPLE